MEEEERIEKPDKVKMHLGSKFNSKIKHILGTGERKGTTLLPKDAIKLFMDLPKEHQFWTKNGKGLNNLQELYQELLIMHDDVFYHHVTQNKNDFASWIRGVIKDKDLAFSLDNLETKEEHIDYLRNYINSKKKEQLITKAKIRPDYFFRREIEKGKGEEEIVSNFLNKALVSDEEWDSFLERSKKYDNNPTEEEYVESLDLPGEDDVNEEAVKFSARKHEILLEIEQLDEMEKRIVQREKELKKKEAELRELEDKLEMKEKSIRDKKIILQKKLIDTFNEVGF